MGFSLKSVGKAISSVADKAAGHFVGAITGGAAGGLSGFQTGLSGGSLGGLSGWDFVSGATGLGQDALNAEMQYAYSKRASDYAFKKNLEMWNLQNAYNDPAAQMERLKAAGLNPNLVYGGGNVTGNTSGNSPSYDTPKASFQDRSIERQQLKLALVDHQQRITNQAIENDLARQRLALQEREADRSDALAQAQIAAYKANLGMVDANISNMGVRNDYNERNLAFRKYKVDLDAYNKRTDAFRANLYNRIHYDTDAKMEREIMKRFGRRPMYMDYLHGFK